MKISFGIGWTSAILVLALGTNLHGASAPLTPGNILISDPFFLGQSIVEYEPDGTLVQTIRVPQPTYAGSAGGITFDDQGLLWLYNGNIQPYLSSWDYYSDTWLHWPYPGWSSYLCFPCQGIGTSENFVFATDEGSFGNPNGLVRFDRRDLNFIRFADGRNYSALTVGLDGVLYARRADDVDPPPPTTIDVFDPTSLALIKTVTLPERSLTIAADAAGQLYGARNHSILQYSPDGTLVAAHQIVTSGALYTVALSPDGRFVAVSSDGEVVVVDSGFIPLNSFFILTGSMAYAAIIPPATSSAVYRTLSVTKAGTGSGVVMSNRDGINCGADCSENYIRGVSVTLTVTPAANSLFAGWSGGGCNGRGSCTVELNADTTVTAIFVTPLTVAASALPTAEVGVSYDEPLITGGLPPYSFSLMKETFPPGLSGNSATGRLTGTPTRSMSKRFNLRAIDQLGSSVSGIFNITVLSELNISTSSLKTGTAGKAYRGTLKAKRGASSYVWSLVSGVLPSGLTLISSTGAITGTPTQTGIFDLLFQVTDPAGGIAQKSLTLRIN